MEGYIVVEELHYIVKHRNEIERGKNKEKYAENTIREYKNKREAIKYMESNEIYTHKLRVRHIIYYFQNKERAESMLRRMARDGTSGVGSVIELSERKKGRKPEKKSKEQEEKKEVKRKSEVYSDELVDRMAELSNLVAELEQINIRRRKELSQADKEQLDIYHEIEDKEGTLSKEGKIELYEALECVLVRRRDAKNDMELINNVKNKKVESLNDRWVKLNEEQMLKRVYMPRVRREA